MTDDERLDCVKRILTEHRIVAKATTHRIAGDILNALGSHADVLAELRTVFPHINEFDAWALTNQPVRGLVTWLRQLIQRPCENCGHSRSER